MLLLGNALGAVAYVLNLLLNLYFWIVVIACALSWFRVNPGHPIVMALRRLTEPVFYKVRRWLPFTYQHGLDFSPVVVLIVIELIQRIIVSTLAQYAARLG